jgi:hypothetical protein
MTSRERVKRCLEFDRPDRVPRDCWTAPSAPARYGVAAIKAFGERWPMTNADAVYQSWMELTAT